MTHPLTQVVLTVSSCRLLLAASCSLPPALRALPCGRATDTAFCLLPTAFCLLPPASCLLPPALRALPYGRATDTAFCLLPCEPSLTVGLLTLLRRLAMILCRPADDMPRATFNHEPVD